MKIKKIISRIKRSFIYKLDGINAKKYMKKYNKWLKKEGMNIDGNIKYAHHTVMFDGSDYSRIFIGNNCVFSIDVIILTHDFSIETGMFSLGLGDDSKEAHFEKNVIIGNNCFFGARSIILPGAVIGDNCIIGAGSVVVGKKYPANCIIAGNPAKVIGNIVDWTNKKIIENNFARGCY